MSADDLRTQDERLAGLFAVVAGVGSVLRAAGWKVRDEDVLLFAVADEGDHRVCLDALHRELTPEAARTLLPHFDTRRDEIAAVAGRPQRGDLERALEKAYDLAAEFSDDPEKALGIVCEHLAPYVTPEEADAGG